MHSFSGSFAGVLETLTQFFWIESVSVCSVSSCHSRQTDDDQIRSDLCGALAVLRQKSHWIITVNGKMNVWKCKLIFPTYTLQQKIKKMIYLKPFFVGGNTNDLKLFHNSV